MANLFDKVITELNKGVTTVSEGSRAVVERAKLNTGLSDAKKERQRLAAELGDAVYRMHLKGVDDLSACNDMFASIAEQDKLIDEMTSQLQAMDAQKEQQSASQENAGKRCASCGTVNKDTAKFCVGCGSPLGE